MPYWRLSGFYFFYFASLGALIPFWGLYLKDRGFDVVAIGELMAVLMATKIIAPNIWGWIADHTGRRMAIVRLASLVSAVIFCGVFFTDSFWSLAVVMMLFSFFWNASLPQFEAVTFNYLGEQVKRYSRIRLWGSVGFIIAVVGLGIGVDNYGVRILPMVILVLYVGIWLISLWVPEQVRVEQHSVHSSLFDILRRPEVAAFLLCCFLMQAGHGAYYAFYSIYLEEQGYSGSLIGQLWALGVIAEVAVFLIMHRLLQRFSARQMLLFSLFFAGIRWLLIGFYPEHLWVLVFAQLLHAATFGTFHAAAIHLVHQYFKGKHQGRGQALYSSLSFGAGGAVGSLYSGYLWAGFGPSVTYSISSVLVLLAFIVAWRWVEPPTHRLKIQPSE